MRTKIKTTPLGNVTSVRVVLSERNLLSMLAKLYQPGSACEIGNNVTDINDEQHPEIVCWLESEADDKHYSAEDRDGAGPMHPDTERFVRKLREVLEEERHPLGPAL